MKLLLALLVLVPGLALAGDFGVNVYGLSYHFERSEARRLGFDNELNPGLGVRYRAPVNASFDWFADVGAYRDSGRNTALLAGPGVFWKPTGGLRLGGAVVFFNSDSYNRGKAFIAPVPVAAYEWRQVTLNVTYFPKVSNFNEINTLGFWLTFWPKEF